MSTTSLGIDLARSAAAQAGVQLDAQAEAAVAGRIDAALVYDQTSGTVIFRPDTPEPTARIEGTTVIDLTPTDVISAIVAQHGAAPAAAARPTGPQMSRPTVSGIGASLDAAAHATGEAKAKAMIAGLNPWSSKSINRTQQAIIRHHFPNAADRLMKEANL